MNERLSREAERCGILSGYHDVWGHWHATNEATMRRLLEAMGVSPDDPQQAEPPSRLLPPATILQGDARPLRIPLGPMPSGVPRHLAWRIEAEDGTRHDGEAAIESGELLLDLQLDYGYHTLVLEGGKRELARTRLILAPPRCYRPPALDGDRRIWGTTVQLYSLRSARNFGIGDFTDLRTVVEVWGEAGAAIFGVNPLHALFPHDPCRISPYSPSSRLYRNVLYLDVQAIEDFGESDEAQERFASSDFQQRLAALRATDFVDYPGVAAAKYELMEMLYASFRDRHLARGDSPRAENFRRFQAREGLALRRHALFEALQERFHAEDQSVWGWQVWPEAYRNPESEAVRAYEREALERIEYFEYLQWQADLQLAALAARASELGCGIGLYEDLAVSIDRSGAEAWSSQKVYATGASVGAPPDIFNPLGQDWGLPPLNPLALVESGFEPFIATLRVNMRHGGAIRIDHVMGLMRLYWVPPGARADEGAYVRYPLDELLAILALESVRNRCLVIGEDLGTVPDELREALAQAGVLSYRLLYFERGDQGSFKAPSEYVREALVAPTTHDLPTLAGWWTARDLTVRGELDLYPNDQVRESQLVERAQDRARLLLALQHENLLPPGMGVDSLAAPEFTPELTRAVFAYLAATPSRALAVPIDDVLGMVEQTNLPGTVDQHPNWRRKLCDTVENLRSSERFTLLAAELVRVRGRCHRPPPRAAATHIPRATYRLQMHKGFTFDDATAIAPYLAALGVSHAYCSPILRARAGSLHGYDIVDHDSLNPEIGDEAAFERFVAALKAHDMGLLLDIVPNHMAVMGSDNAWWSDVLEHGPASAYAGFFDIYWTPPDDSLANKVLLPVLGDHYGKVLEEGSLELGFEMPAASFAVRYYEHRFPIDPREYPRILGRAVDRLAPGALPDPDRAEFDSLVAAFGHLPPREATEPAAASERRRDSAVLRGRLAALAERHPAITSAIAGAVEMFNGTAGERESFDALDALLEAQAYRLANWRTAADEINYRRFFDVNHLAALRMENPEVFDATHRYVLQLAAAGKVDALRIDHSDGLYDPGGYFARLQAEYASLIAARTGAAPQDPRPLYVVAEKIAAPHENLPADWALYGTTGYRYANLVNGLFVATQARTRFDRLWRALVRGEAERFDELAYQGKRAVMAGPLASELTAQAHALLRLARTDRRTRDFTLNTLRQALAEVVACLPVYRTYVTLRPTPQDRRYIDWAVAQARRRTRGGEPTIFEFVRAVLLLDPPADAPETLINDWRAFVRRFQQFTGAVTAKGIEDTAFYRFNRLVSLNEVGGRPDQFGITVSAFHGANASRAAQWPHSLLGSSTHDTKRSEDVRLRIDVLSEVPDLWRDAVRRWARLNRSRRHILDGMHAPSPNEEYLYYQTLVGSLPARECDADEWNRYRDRLKDYMIKAVREAKRHTSWIDANPEYEDAVTNFVSATLDPSESNLFLDDLRGFARSIAWFGALSSLSMVLLKLTSPGVPDIYQGNELLDLSLVDPDNRRPVDYGQRRSALAAAQEMCRAAPDALASWLQELAGSIHDGRLKLWITTRALALRHAQPDLFRAGDYLAIDAEGEAADHVVAFARRDERGGVLVVAGRLFASLGPTDDVIPVGDAVWGKTSLAIDWLPAGMALQDVLSGNALTAGEDGSLPLDRVFTVLPLALLHYRTVSAE